MVQDLILDLKVILDLKADNVEACFILSGVSFQDLGPKLDILSVPKCAVFLFLLPILKLYLSLSSKLKTLFIIIGESTFVVCQRG